MAAHTDLVPTGITVLDRMLTGGLPKERSVLVVGGPGTGKSTFGMQFLQTGLSQNEQCLYVSTEQTIEEIQQSFTGFAFDLDHDNLSITSIHATSGQTIESEDALTLQTLDSGDSGSPLGEYGIPFTIEYIEDHLKEFAPVDRVVFDSSSGLEAIAEDPSHYRRLLLDLIRFFGDELEATTIFTAEEGPNRGLGSDVLQFTTHGVIRFSYNDVNQDRHRFVEITKMRGVDHDHRRVEAEFTEDGLRLSPQRRSQPPELKSHAHQPIGIEGLDSLTGGGLAVGAGVLLQHDGQTNLNAFLTQLLSFGLEDDRTVLLVPTIELRESRIRRVLQRGFEWSLEELLTSGQLAVIDVIGGWDQEQANVYGAPEDIDAYTSLLERITDPADELLGLINADALVHSFGSSDARRARYFTEAHIVDTTDIVVHVQNPGVVSDEIAAFYHDAAEQVLRTWVEDDGLQYVTLEKSPCGFVGSTSLIEYMNTHPYLRVQSPPQSRTNPHANE